MASFERVLTGRPARRTGEPWTGQAGLHRSGSAGLPGQPGPGEPLAPEAAEAMLRAAMLQAEDRGYAAGRQQAEQELAAAIAATQALVRSLETAVPRDVDMVARTVAELAVLVARRILGAELRNDASVLVAAIEAGLRQAAGASVINVELHPMVVDAVEAAWTARHGTRHRGFTWSFSGDPTLAPDGCRLRTEHGVVEAGFEDQLAEVAAALDAAIPGYLASALGPSGAGPGAKGRRSSSHETGVAPAGAGDRSSLDAGVPGDVELDLDPGAMAGFELDPDAADGPA